MLSARDVSAVIASFRNTAGVQRDVVCVQGLGFVGAAMAVALASARKPSGDPLYTVVGVDLPTQEGRARAEALNRGEFPFAMTDRELVDRTRAAHCAANLMACTDSSALALASVIVVDVPFDVRPNNVEAAAGLESFREAIRAVGAHMRPNALVVLETTVLPGTTSHIVAPLLARELTQRGLPCDEMRLAHSYERVMPGAGYLDSIINMRRVYAGIDEGSADACEAFLSSVINVAQYPLTRLSSTTASEIGKALENSYRAISIALMQEWGTFSERVGVDLFEVVNSIRARETHNNMRTPGFGVGGYCLTKDPLMGQLAAREIFGFEHSFPFSTLAVEVNREMPKHALARLQVLLGHRLAGQTILLLGVSYREDVGDSRYSPSETFFRGALEHGARVLVHDPLVTYWREQQSQVLSVMPAAKDLDAVVLAVPHRQYRDFDFEAWVDGHPLLFFDGFNVLSKEQRLRLRARGCRVESIGRGQGL